MIRKIKARLRRRLIKTTVRDTVTLDGVVYKVIDKTCRLPFIKSTRHLYFRQNGRLCEHSSICINPKYLFQPSMRIPQTVIARWSERYALHSTLVLGCAGCSVPRFIGLRFPESKTVGVEISDEFIAIAKTWFLLDQIEKQFELIQGDAVSYMKEYPLDYKQDVVYVDLFCGSTFVADVFSGSFIRALYNNTEEDALIVINIFGQDVGKMKAVFDALGLPFGSMAVVRQGNAQFLVLTKSTDPQREEAFLNKLKAENDMTVTMDL